MPRLHACATGFPLLLLLLLLATVLHAAEVAPATPTEAALLESYLQGDCYAFTSVGFSGRRLHEIIADPARFGDRLVAGAIMAHEYQSHADKRDGNCWNADYIAAMLRGRALYSERSTAHLAETLRLQAHYYPNAKAEALSLISRFDYPRFTDPDLRGQYHLIAGFTKLGSKTYPAGDAIRDFTAAADAFALADRPESFMRAKMELIKAKMLSSVYETYRADLDPDIAAAERILPRLDQADPQIGSFYHTKGLHASNQALKNKDAAGLQASLGDLERARVHKAAHPKTANAPAATLKICGDIALRLGVEYKVAAAENAAIARDRYLEALALKPNFSFDEYREMLCAIYISMNEMHATQEFVPLLQSYADRDDTDPNCKAAIQYLFAMLKRKNP